jgi:uncharacterized protein Yka (UPF0111/DUF47 family)
MDHDAEDKDSPQIGLVPIVEEIVEYVQLLNDTIQVLHQEVTKLQQVTGDKVEIDKIDPRVTKLEEALPSRP